MDFDQTSEAQVTGDPLEVI